jgi:hypothetical protein
MGRPLTAIRSEPLEDRPPLTNPTTGIGGCCARAAGIRRPTDCLEVLRDRNGLIVAHGLRCHGAIIR